MLSTASLIEDRARDLAGLEQAVIATDADGQVVFWNGGARRLYGWEPSEAVGRSILDLTPTRLSREDASRIMELLRRGHHWSGEFPVQRKDGSTFIAHVVDAPVHDDTGELVGVIGISSDTSPLTRLQRLSRDLLGAVTPVDVADLALRQLAEVTGSAAGWFMQMSDDGSCLELLHSLGYEPDVVARFPSVPMDAPLPIAQAARDRRPIFIASREEWANRFPSAVALADARTLAWIAVPLVLNGACVGAVGLSVRVRRDFLGEDRDLVLTMAEHAAIALVRARRFAIEHTARVLAEESSRTKAALLATMSHELRTPLGAIIGYHDLIADELLGPVTDSQRQHLKRLRNSATHLLSLIDELLTFARLEAEREQVHTDDVVLGQLVESVSDMVIPLARSKKLDWRVEVEGATTAVRTDAQKVKQILVNLAGNALKYTERGTVLMTCRVADDVLTVSVRDTGVGIATSDIENLFRPYWRADTRGNRATTGSGLGLAVSRSLARLLGGDIRVVSELGVGSTFTLTVPIAPRA